MTTPSRRNTESSALAEQGIAGGTEAVIIGPKIHIKGELLGNQDLTIHGQVEGAVRLRGHHLTIGTEARVKASIQAKSVKIDGTVEGNVSAAERVELSRSGVLTGDIDAPRISISDGARFRGTVNMKASGALDSAATISPGKPMLPEESRERRG